MTYSYWAVSGYGEKPLRCFGFLLFTCFVIPFFLSSFFSAESISWQYFFPIVDLGGVPVDTGSCVQDVHAVPVLAKLVKVFLKFLMTINAALLAFAVRNKLRR
ncbi:hypothetical protein SAMN06295933_1725 [Desulfovibrio gilichinskyi]|uniref:Uncharacterized protein n=1 Tax=Desulfovibrio gilichinskyi TaxID=1519643 RepID=A0A1X7D6F5_9BACT|nr:hypothetical protein SAMN06295933_1725 [Desulfovibrio gilichinskyi]